MTGTSFVTADVMAEETNMSKHTPGPWEAVDKRKDGCAGYSIFNGSQYLAHVGDSDGATPVDANAKLIAAAPDLLAAAKKVNALSIQTQAHQELRAAIAKAEV